MGVELSKKSKQTVQIGETSLIRDINFFRRYQELEKSKSNISRDTITKTACVLGVGVAIVGVRGSIQVMANELKYEISSIQSYIDSADIQKQLATLGQKVEVYTVMDQYHKIIANVDKQIGTHIQFTIKHLEKIREILPKNTRIEDIEYTQGSFQVKCTTDAPKKITEYVSKLRSIPFIEDVLYDGFVTETEEKAMDTNAPSKKEYTTSIRLKLLSLEVQDETK